MRRLEALLDRGIVPEELANTKAAAKDLRAQVSEYHSVQHVSVDDNKLLPVVLAGLPIGITCRNSHSLGPRHGFDHPQIRQAFHGLPLVPLQLEYSMAREATGKKSWELIIKSWEDDQLPMWG